MTNLEDREKAFEAKFAHDAELQFKAEARRTRLLARWAAGLLGLEDEEAIDSYAGDLILADMREKGDDDLFRKLKADLEAKDVKLSETEIRSRMSQFLDEAKASLATEG